jgi:hypothetical protein
MRKPHQTFFSNIANVNASYHTSLNLGTVEGYSISTKEKNLIDIEIELFDGISEKNLSNYRRGNSFSHNRSQMIPAKDANNHALVDVSNTDTNLGKTFQLHGSSPHVVR